MSATWLAYLPDSRFWIWITLVMTWGRTWLTSGRQFMGHYSCTSIRMETSIRWIRRGAVPSPLQSSAIWERRIASYRRVTTRCRCERAAIFHSYRSKVVAAHRSVESTLCLYSKARLVRTFQKRCWRCKRTSLWWRMRWAVAILTCGAVYQTQAKQSLTWEAARNSRRRALIFIHQFEETRQSASIAFIPANLSQ